MNRLSRTEKYLSYEDQQVGDLKEETIYKADQGITANGTIKYSLEEGETLIVTKYAKKQIFKANDKIIDFFARDNITATGMSQIYDSTSRLYRVGDETNQCGDEGKNGDTISEDKERVQKMREGIKFMLPIMIASFLFAALSSVALTLMYVGKFQSMDPNILILFIIAGFGWGVTCLHAIIKDIRRLT